MPEPLRSPLRVAAAGALAWLALAGALHAQRGPAPVESPTVHEDGRVTFRVRAPASGSVELAAPWAGGRRLPLEKGPGGLWSLTVGPVPPAIYSYALLLDGVRVLDPHNAAVKRWSGGNASLVEVRSSDPRPYDLRDVPHGALHVHYYSSSTGGPHRRLVVYTPPGYESDAGSSYPVLYLLHGSGDDETAWTEVGKANLILDNLIAAGEAEPMLLVMPNGHPVPWSARRRGLASGNSDAFVADLLEGAVPLVESLYRADPSRERRAVAGLSMGGGQALRAGTGNLDRFAWVGAFSAAAPNPDGDPAARAFLGDPQRANERLRLLWIAVGRDDFLLERNEALKARLETAGIRHVYRLTDGGHSWPVWRGYLARMAPLLFR